MSTNFVRSYVNSKLQNVKTHSLAVEGNAYIRGLTSLNELQVDSMFNEGPITVNNVNNEATDGVDLHVKKNASLVTWFQADAVDEAGPDEDTDLFRLLLSHNKETSLLELTPEDGTSTYNLFMGDTASGLAGNLSMYTRQVDNSGDIPEFDPLTGKLILTANDRGLFVNDLVEVDGDSLISGKYRVVEDTIVAPVYRNCDLHIQKNAGACIYVEADQNNGIGESQVPVFLSTSDGGGFGYNISMDGAGNQVTFTSGNAGNTTSGNFNFYSAQLVDPGTPNMPDFDTSTRIHTMRITDNAVRTYGYTADFTATADMSDTSAVNVTGLTKVSGESGVTLNAGAIVLAPGTYTIRLRTDNTGSASTTLQSDMYKSVGGVDYGADRKTAVALAGYEGILETQWLAYFDGVANLTFILSDDTVNAAKPVEIMVLRHLALPLFPA